MIEWKKVEMGYGGKYNEKEMKLIKEDLAKNKIKREKIEKMVLFEMPMEIKFTKQEKIEWYKKLRKYAEKEYMEVGGLTGKWCCGCMRICNLCEQKYQEGCKDCVESIKEWHRIKNKEIDYKNHDFKKLMQEIEGWEE